MKLLLYCTKAKPYLTRNDLPNEKGEFYKHWQLGGELDKKHLYGDTPILNGKIVAECDYDAEPVDLNSDNFDWLLEAADTTIQELQKYVGNSKTLYATHIKNLNVFDKSKELSDYYSQGQVDWIEETELWRLNGIKKAPLYMCYAYKYDFRESKLQKYILISVSPREMCRIANKEQTALLRKKMLKG